MVADKNILYLNIVQMQPQWKNKIQCLSFYVWVQ